MTPSTVRGPAKFIKRLPIPDPVKQERKAKRLVSRKKKLILQSKRDRRDSNKPYHNGRWRRVKQKVGRTTFNLGDTVHFRPSKMKAQVVRVLPTTKGVPCYMLRTFNGVELFAFGSELLLVQRRPKPKFVKHQPVVVPPVVAEKKPWRTKPTLTKKPDYSRPDDLVARVVWWAEHLNKWVYYDAMLRTEVEPMYWRLVLRDKIPAKFVSIEWSPDFERKENAEHDARIRKLLSEQKAALRRESRRKREAAKRAPAGKRKAAAHSPAPHAGNAGRSGKGGKKKPACRASNKVGKKK